MLWCFPPVPLCNISCSLTWRGLTSQPGPHPSALLILPPHFSSLFYATMKTNSLQLCPPHTIFVSCLFAFVQAVPFSYFLFILLFSLTFWSLLADMHSINYYMTAPQPGWELQVSTALLQLYILYIYCSLFSASVCVLSWPVHEFLEGKYCVYFIYVLSVPRTALGKYWQTLFLGWGEEKEWVGGWMDDALKGNTTWWA